MKSKVYFTRALTPEAVVKMYNALGVELPGKVAVKIHTGEQGNQNYMPPEFWKPMIDEIGGTVCETNTAYGDASAGVRDHTDTRFECWDKHASSVVFPEAMADAASSIYRHFEGKIAFVNVMKNLSVDCDCCAVAEDPCMADIGIRSSTDPVAIDQACMDLVMNSDDPGREHFMERVNSRNGIHTIEAAAELGFGSREYELIEI